MLRPQGSRAGKGLREHLPPGTEGGRAVSYGAAPFCGALACIAEAVSVTTFPGCVWLTCRVFSCAGLPPRLCRAGRRCVPALCLLRQRMIRCAARLADVRHAPSRFLRAQELLKTELEEKTYEAEDVKAWYASPTALCQQHFVSARCTAARAACSLSGDRMPCALATTGLFEFASVGE